MPIPSPTHFQIYRFIYHNAHNRCCLCFVPLGISRPEEILDPPVSSDALRPAWLVGFDGAVWDGAKMDAGCRLGVTHDWSTNPPRNVPPVRNKS